MGFVNMDSIVKDLRFAVRALAKHPGFTGIAVIILALAIGATTSIFSGQCCAAATAAVS